MIDLASQAIIEVGYDGTPEMARRISLATQVPSWAVRRREPACEPARQHGRRWTRWQDGVVKAHLGMLSEDEVEQLRQEVPSPGLLDDLGNLSLEEIGKKIGRSGAAVKIRLTRQGWPTFKNNQEWLTARAVAALMGVDEHTVTKWMRRGYLKADRFPYPGRHIYRTSREEVERFVRSEENHPYYHPEKIVDSELRKLARSVRNGNEYISTAQLARRLGCSTNWIATLIIRGKIPATKWGNWHIHRDDAAKVKLTGVGKANHASQRAFSPEEDRYIALARSVGIAYAQIGEKIGREVSVVAYRWYCLKRDGLVEDEAVLVAGGRVLGSWRVLAKRERTAEFIEVARTMGRLRAGRALSRREMSVAMGVFGTWVEFFVDGRQLRRERNCLRLRPWRQQEKLEAVRRQLLDWGLDPCREQWTREWESVIGTGKRRLGWFQGWETWRLEWRGWAQP